MRTQKPAALRRGLFCITLLFLLSASAEAAPRLALFGVGTSSSLKYFSEAGSALSGPVESQLGYGGGLSLEFPLGARMGVELGAAYLWRKVRDTTVSPNLTSAYSYLMMPLQLRLHLGRVFSIAAGAYGAHAIGTIRDDTGGSTSYSAAGYRRLEYGLVGGLAIAPFGSALFFEGRYVYGLGDNIDHGVADALDATLVSQRARWREIQALFGLRFGAGK